MKIPEVKRTIFDFFQIDLKNIPDNSFIEAEVEIGGSGESVQNFRKSLDYRECGIFDTVEIKVIGESGKNIIFKSFQPDNINVNNLQKLIDDLYSIYGNDSDDKGKFTNNDKEEYQNAQAHIFFGRSWMDFPKYKYPVSITRDGNEVSITIWGIGLE